MIIDFGLIFGTSFGKAEFVVLVQCTLGFVLSIDSGL